MADPMRDERVGHDTAVAIAPGRGSGIAQLAAARRLQRRRGMRAARVVWLVAMLTGVPGCLGCDPIELPSCWNGPDSPCDQVGEQCENCGPLGCADASECTCGRDRRWQCVNPHPHDDLSVPVSRDFSMPEDGGDDAGATDAGARD
jgi:hypothetical protein